MNANDAVSSVLDSKLPEDEVKLQLRRARRCLQGLMRFLEIRSGTPRDLYHLDWACGRGGPTDEIAGINQALVVTGGAS